MALTREALIEYLVDQHDVEADDLEDDTPIFSSGILDSFSLVDLILFIEEAAGIKMSPADVNLENLDSIEAILAFAQSAA
jgi:acyl carrier protein